MTLLKTAVMMARTLVESQIWKIQKY